MQENQMSCCWRARHKHTGGQTSINHFWHIVTEAGRFPRYIKIIFIFAYVSVSGLDSCNLDADMVLEDKPSSHCFLALLSLVVVVLPCCQPVICTMFAWTLHSDGVARFLTGSLRPGGFVIFPYTWHSLRTVSVFPSPLWLYYGESRFILQIQIT